MSRLKRPRLSEDDLSIWRKVAETATPLGPPSTRLKPDARPLDPLPRLSEPQVQNQPQQVPAFRVGEVGRYDHSKGHDLVPTLETRLAAQPVRMDSKAFRKMKRGKLSPERKIDLHGMTLAQAHPVLSRFILRSHADGLRLVMVVTGKGKVRDGDGPIPTPRGVLKHQVPMWLAMPPLAQAVLQVSPAHISHGGGGAYYVYLRRHR